MTSHIIGAELLARFRTASEELEAKARHLCSSDQTVADDTREWLDGQGPPLRWQNPKGITADECFFVTTLYGNMNPEGQRTMIQHFFEALFVGSAKRDVRNFRDELPGYEGLRSPWMKHRLCTMAAILRSRGISMEQYVDELRALERNASEANPTPALDKIVQDHGATGVKTLSVFVRDCVGGNCFPIDLRVKRQLEKYELPLDERLLVRLSLALGRNPRELARVFYEAEMNLDLVDFSDSKPCVFYTWEDKGWQRDRCGDLIRQKDALKFDIFDGEIVDFTCTMALEKDGLYHWRDPEGPPGHWWGFVSETETHSYLVCNFINPISDGHRGVQIFVWPKSH
jgi:hypothetical protein